MPKRIGRPPRTKPAGARMNLYDMPTGMKAQIEELARQNRRSASQEAIALLEKALAGEPAKDGEE